MGDIIPFPSSDKFLTEEEFQRFEIYRRKMSEATSSAELDYYFNQARMILENAIQRKIDREKR
ncbi:hypothetical protein [Halobacillus litoralis]|uniref:hypothetical protein n=1 Tax=Halobacillus litoralis TaxID=45668 RepID=UPI001CFE7B77|nr:hypothetical protein [Halobacillus litoralis]